jgi:3-dehydroquinate dehydratase-2
MANTAGTTPAKHPGNSMTYRILILNGPNLGVLGIRQPEIYGQQGMDAVSGLVSALLEPRSEQVQLDFFQSNHEGALLDRLEQAHHERQDGIVFNAGAYTHTSLALADCLAWIRVPCVEVHISNIFARETLRQQSMLARHTVGVVSGFGILGYALAVQALVHHYDNDKNKRT